MADIARTVDIIFGGKNLLSGPASGVLGTLDKIDSTIHKVTRPLSDFGDKLLKWEAAMAALAVGGLAASVKMAGDFSDQVAEISTLTGASATQINQFKNDILVYSRDSTASLDSINDALYQAISLGTDYSESLDLIGRAEKLAVAGKADLVDTTELLGSTLNAYGASVDEAGRYSDVFFETVKLGKTTIPELASNLSKVTGIASSGKVPIETLSAALAALTATGMDTAEASTALRGIMSSIIDPTAGASKAAAELGISFGAGALEAKGLDGILKEVYQTTGGNTEEIAKLFENVRALNGALILGSDNSGKFAGALKAMETASGSTQEAYEKMAQNFSLANQTLVNNLKATMIQVGQPLLETYGSTARAITEIFKGISIAFDAGAFKPLYDALEQFADKAITFIEGVGKALPEALSEISFDPVLDALAGFGGALAEFFRGLDFTDPQDLARIIQGTIDTAASMIEVTRGMAEQFKPLFNFIIESIDKFNKTDNSFKRITGSVITLAMETEKFGTIVMPLINLLGDKLLTILDVLIKIEKLPFQLTEAIASLRTPFDFETIRKEWGEVFSMQHLLEPARQETKEISEEVVEWWASAATSSAEKVDKALDESGESWKKYRDTSVSSLSDISSEALPKVTEELGQVESKQISLQKTWQGEDGTIYFQQVKDAAKEAGIEIGENLPDAWKNNIQFFEAETKRLSDMLQFQATISTKQMELDMKKLEVMAELTSAAFESIGKSIESTGTSLTELSGIFAGGGLDPYAWVTIRDAMKAEEARRQESFDLQRKLTEQQIEQSELEIEALKLRNQKLARGENLIRIESVNLAPHLEAIMWEILHAVQVRASEEGVDFLLGL